MSYDAYEVSITPTSTGIRNLDRWDALGLEQIDEAFITVFGEFKESLIQIGTDTQEYKSALADYSGHCINAGRGVQERSGQSGATTFVAEIKKALAWGRVSADYLYPLPFPTRSFIVWIFALFKSITNSVKEVSLVIFSHVLLRSSTDPNRLHRRTVVRIARPSILIMHIRVDIIFAEYAFSVCAYLNR